MADKKRERYYFAALREAVPGLPPGDPDECEPPDFILRAGNVRLGVEITAFYLPPSNDERPHQEQQSLRGRIVQMAERLHSQAGGPALYVGVVFNQCIRLGKSDTRRIARSIAESVLKAPMPRSMREPVELAYGERPEEVWSIQIHPSVDGRDKLWHPDAGGWVADITPRHVADVIAAKARMAPTARKHCDSLWLVIVEDNFGLGAPAEITSDALSAEYSGPFDRIYWLAISSPPRAMPLKLTGSAA